MSQEQAGTESEEQKYRILGITPGGERKIISEFVATPEAREDVEKRAEYFRTVTEDGADIEIEKVE